MDDTAYVYQRIILYAVFGDKWRESKVEDLARINQISMYLVECEKAKKILQARGYGKSGMSFDEVAASVPENVRGLLRGLFRPAGTKAAKDRADLDEALDIWTSR